MKKPTVAIVRGKFLNRFEMQSYEPLVRRYRITAFSSLTPPHEHFAFPVTKLASPMDLPGFPFKMSILNRMFIDAHYLLGLEKRLKGFDLVHTAETYYRYTQQALNAKKKGYVKKVIATVWETIPHNNEGIWGRKMFKSRAIRELDHIIAVTKKAKSALITEGTNSEKITVIAPGIDIKRFSPAKHRTRPLTVLFCGRLEPEKGVDDILSAMKVLPKTIRWRFVGDGSFKKEVIARGLSVTHVPYEKMPQVYHDADIFVAPSKPRFNRDKSTKTWEEQYGMALLEAQASGLPIVTTRSGGIPENVGDTAILIEPGDARALAVAINDLLIHPSKRMNFAKRARERALAVHDARRVALKIADLYDRLLAV